MARSAAGFTLIEILVALAVVALLVGLVSIGVRGAVRAARDSAERRAVLSLQQAVDQFKQAYGFYPPLMKRSSSSDTLDLLEKPGSDRFNRLNVYRTGRSGAINDEDLLRDRIPKRGGLSGPNNIFEDERYSEFTFVAYLMGDGPANCSEADGTPNSTKDPIDKVPAGDSVIYGTPDTDGTFGEINNRKSGRLGEAKTRRVDGAQQALINPSGKGSNLELKDVPPSGSTEVGKYLVIANRKGVPIRYYRWLNGTKAPTGELKLESFTDFKAPRLIGRVSGLAEDTRLAGAEKMDGDTLVDERDIEKNTALRARGVTLREAGYAIVSAGQNGVYGDESNLDVLIAATGFRPDTGVPDQVKKLRLLAAKDNIVVVGQ
jgi:prepilin-type N-terminal cleavage/methylation domain-containing protein